MLAESPIGSFIYTELGPVAPDSDDHRDRRILAALRANAVNLLVSAEAEAAELSGWDLVDEMCRLLESEEFGR